MTQRSQRSPRKTTFSRDEIVIRLIEQGVPRWKAEKEADRQAVEGFTAPKPKPRARVKKTAGMSAEARIFRVLCQDNGLPMPIPDYRFATELGSNLEIDYAWVPERVGLENQGGIWREGGGAHQGKGHIRDMRKQNLAHQLGWRILQCVPTDLFSPLTLDMVRQALTSSEAA